MFRRELGMVESIVGVSTVTKTYFFVRSERIFERVVDALRLVVLAQFARLVYSFGSGSSEGVSVY